jgi:integrase
MARTETGQVVERKRKRGRVFALRFRAGGQRQYITLPDGMSREEAERELRHVLADVERGTWRPPEPAPEIELPEQEPTFHQFASEWWESKKRELRPGTVQAYEWQLTYLLLPFFAKHRLSEITVQEVDRYKAQMIRRRERGERLSNETINKTLVRLGQILEVAVEYELLNRNPATGKRRKLIVSRPHRSYLDAGYQIEALLDGAGKLDAEKRSHDLGVKRLVLSTLLLSGLRIGELVSLRWRDVDLSTGRITVTDAKTDAGVRTIELLPALREDLAAWKARTPFEGSAELVFPTNKGKKISASNVRKRLLDKAVERANAELERDGMTPLPERLTPHSMRRTFASLLFAIGRTPVEVMDQLGHTDPTLSLRIYARAMRRDLGEVERLKALAGLSDWAPMGTSAQNESESESAAVADSAL